MFRHLLVPLDGSPCAERALPCAQRLATRHGATLHLVRVVELPPDRTRMPACNMDLKLLSEHVAEAITYLETLRTQPAATGCTVRIRVFTGDAATALLHYEQAAGIDLVIMGSRGRQANRRADAGSVAAALEGRGAAPLLLMHTRDDPVCPDHALVLLDGSAQAEGALRAVEALAPAVVRAVTLLRVIAAPAQAPEAHRYLEHMAGSLQGAVDWCAWRVEQGDPARVIRSLAKQDTLVVLPMRGQGGIPRRAVEPVAAAIARGGRTSVLLWRGGGYPACRNEPVAAAARGA